MTRQNRGKHLRKDVRICKLLRCLIRASLRNEKHRSFLFSGLDLRNRTDPGEAVRNCFYLRAAISDCLLIGFIRATETLRKN
jgi:hypothetical protein